jgi:hypothetical protein
MEVDTWVEGEERCERTTKAKGMIFATLNEREKEKERERERELCLEQIVNAMNERSPNTFGCVTKQPPTQSQHVCRG